MSTSTDSNSGFSALPARLIAVPGSSETTGGQLPAACWAPFRGSFTLHTINQTGGMNTQVAHGALAVQTTPRARKRLFGNESSINENSDRSPEA